MALAHALKMLEKSARSVAEIERALQGRGHGEEEIVEVIAKLRGYGYLDDQAVAGLEKERTIEQQKFGKGRLLERFEQRGLGDEVTAEQLKSLSDESELSRALLLIDKRDPNRSQPVAKIGRWLASRGFDEEIVESALDRAYPHWRD